MADTPGSAEDRLIARYFRPLAKHPGTFEFKDDAAAMSQLTDAHRVATPVNWKPGEDVIIAGSVSDDDAKKVYPQGWKSPRPYIRIVPQP